MPACWHSVVCVRVCVDSGCQLAGIQLPVCVCVLWMPACWRSVMSQVACLDSWCLQPCAQCHWLSNNRKWYYVKNVESFGMPAVPLCRSSTSSPSKSISTSWILCLFGCMWLRSWRRRSVLMCLSTTKLCSLMGALAWSDIFLASVARIDIPNIIHPVGEFGWWVSGLGQQMVHK